MSTPYPRPPQPPPPARVAGDKHSGLGVASLVLSVLVGMAIFALCVVAGIMESSAPGGMDESAPATMVLGLGIILLILANFLPLGLGIAALFQQGRKKVLAILGVVFSCVIFLGVAALLVVGAMMT